MKYYTENEIKFIYENYEKWGGAYCAKHLVRNSESVGNKARSLGLTAKHAIKHPSMCPNFQYEIINKPTKELAYCMGFMWADGNISHYYSSNGRAEHFRVEWEIIKEDADDIIDIFQTFSTWSRYFRKRKENWQETSTQAINNRWLYKFLYEMDFSNKNQGFQKCLDYLPPELHSYFILGFFDGDGYISYTESVKCITFTSNLHYNWDSFKHILDEQGIVFVIDRYTHPTKGHSYSKLSIRKKVEVDKFYNTFIHPNLDFGLLRKRPTIPK